MESLTPQLAALAQIIAIDVVLAGDNAIVVGMAASRVAPELRTKVIFWGVAGAVVLRILFAAIATQLLAIVGLTLAGGILLLWVCWKMYREIRHVKPESAIALAAAGSTRQAAGTRQAGREAAGFWRALTQIIVADVSMSLDNVLAVAGAAKGETWVLVVGLTIAVILMALVANGIARLLARHGWITWVGLLVILYVALDMIWDGSHEVACRFVSASVCERGLLAIFGAMF
jgi:YjbE family integral membrane protein